MSELSLLPILYRTGNQIKSGRRTTRKIYFFVENSIKVKKVPKYIHIPMHFYDMKKDRYSKDVRNVFEIVATYFTNIFYNDIYKSAKIFHIEKEEISTVTDGYYYAMDKYVKSIQEHRHYKTTVEHIAKQFSFYLNNHIMNLGGCVDYIVKQFVPKDYFDSLTSKQKDQTLGRIIMQTIKGLRAAILDRKKGHIMRIIDDHKTQENIHMLKLECLDIICIQREKIFEEFVNEKLYGTKKKVVEASVVEKMQKFCEEQVKKNKELMKEKEEFVKTIKSQFDRYSKLQLEKDKLQADNDELRMQISHLMENISGLKHRLQQQEYAPPPQHTPPPPQHTPPAHTLATSAVMLPAAAVMDKKRVTFASSDHGARDDNIDDSDDDGAGGGSDNDSAGGGDTYDASAVKQDGSESPPEPAPAEKSTKKKSINFFGTEIPIPTEEEDEDQEKTWE